MHINSANILLKKRFWAGVLLAQFLLFFTFSKFEFFIGIFEAFFEWKKYAHQALFARLTFSVGDVWYVLLVLLLLYLVFQSLKKKTRSRSALTLLILLNILYFCYQLCWGMLYFQSPLLEKLPKGEISMEYTKKLSLKYLARCRESRSTVHEDRNGVFKVYNSDPVKAEILRNQSRLPSYLNLKKQVEINSFKPSLYIAVMSYSGVQGYYNPFTSEAQYNPRLPSTHLPFTLAHENAHQLGYAREQEANFIGYLLGKNADNADLRYSTDYFVLKSLLNTLTESDPAFVKNVIQNYPPAMKRDRLAELMFRKRHAGMVDTFFGFTNDLFLKSNQQEGKITYSYFVELLIRYEKMHDEAQ